MPNIGITFQWSDLRRRLEEAVVAIFKVRITEMALIRIGLCLFSKPKTGFPDMTRGEEIQMFWTFAIREWRDGHLCLPGGHSKWVALKTGKFDSPELGGPEIRIRCSKFG